MIEGSPHPSAGMHGKVAPGTRQNVKDALHVAEVLRQKAHQSVEALMEAVDNDLVDRHKAAIQAYGTLGIPHNAGWLPGRWRHLRLVD